MSPFVTAILGGKTLYRTLMERVLCARAGEVRGAVLDLASGTGTYVPLFMNAASVHRTDMRMRPGLDQEVDCNLPLPFSDASFDAVLLLNAIYALDDRAAFFREVFRVLRPGGRFLLVSPFIANEMPEPHDYVRLTAEGLERELGAVPWANLTIHRFGERFSAAANLLHPALGFSLVRLGVYYVATWLDRLIPARARRTHPCPLGYLAETVK